MIEELIVLDGGMGRELKNRGVHIPETIWSANALLTAPEIVTAVHLDYIKAGAEIITMNNYAVVPELLEKERLEDQFIALTQLAYELANKAREQSKKQSIKIAASLPPLSTSYRPDLIKENAEEVYRQIVAVLEDKVDLFICETMSSKKEAQDAARAACESGKPVWVSWTLNDDDSKTLRSGETIEEAFESLNGLEVEAFLFNCCTPESISAALTDLRKLTDKPIGAYANAFEPVPKDWDLEETGFLKTREDLSLHTYLDYVKHWKGNDAVIIGGCCGIGPEHIQQISELKSK